MKNLSLVLVFLAGSVLFSGCTLQNMIKAAQDSNLQVTPSPLEVHGGKVPHKLTAELQPKVLPKGKTFTIYTIYKYGGKTTDVGNLVVNADDYPEAKDQVTPVDKDFNFDYVDGMNPGQLVMVGEAKDPNKPDKAKYSDTLSLAQGLILTSLLIQDVSYSAYADHGYTPKDEYEPTNIDFFFDKGKSNVRANLSTGEMSNRDRREKLSAFVAEKNVTKTVTITGTHSPEGPEDINSKLAPDRASAIEKIYKSNMDKYDYKGMADSIEFISKPVIQDWAEFKAALNSYEGVSQEAKSQMLQVINGTGTFVDKELAIRKIDGYNDVVDDLYPGLRSAKTEILTLIEKKTPAEIAVLAKAVVDGSASPDTLSTEEMLFAGEQTPSLEEKVAIYKAAAAKDGSWVAHNNLAATYIEMAKRGDASMLDEALTQLEIANNKNSGSPEVALNMASIYVMQGDDDQAYDALPSGGGNDITANANSIKGTIEAKRGEYDAAVASFNNATNDAWTSYNKGLAQLLNKNYTEAGSALDAAGNTAEDDKAVAMIDYVKAVNAARQGNAEDVVTYLKSAVSKNADLKEMALADLEFRAVKDAVNSAVN